MIDEFNRPAQADYGALRVPPSDAEVEALFGAWREWLPSARKFLPAARDYLAASLWRRTGLRIQETYMLDIRDWRRDLGEYGKIHVRFGKGSKGRGPKTRLTPAINQADALLEWWMAEVRHQFGDDWTDPDAPLLPSERRDEHTGFCRRAGRPDAAGRAGRRGRAVAAGMVGPADPAHAAALLRLVAVCPRHGPQGDPGASGSFLAVDHDQVHPCARRSHRARVGGGQRADGRPARAAGREVRRCAGTCG